MGIIEDICREPKDIEKAEKVSMEKGSIQYNAQDLRQEQKCDMNPIQSNIQNIHIHINNEGLNLAAKITGITLADDTQEVLAHTEIRLYCGHENINPVYITQSDDNGVFAIEDIPPGYYTLHAHCGGRFKCSSCFIKALPGQKVYESILL